MCNCHKDINLHGFEEIINPLFIHYLVLSNILLSVVTDTFVFCDYGIHSNKFTVLSE